jgi:hypothetical protein
MKFLVLENNGDTILKFTTYITSLNPQAQRTKVCGFFL